MLFDILGDYYLILSVCDALLYRGHVVPLGRKMFKTLGVRE